LDELQVIQWALQSNTVPIYGYASRDPDAFAQGKALVQGQLSLNYVVDDYMLVVLNEYNKTKAAGSTSTTDPTVQEYASLLAKKKTLVAQGSSTPGQAQALADTQNRLSDILSNVTPSQVSKIKTATPSASPTAILNAVYDKTVFDIRIDIGEGAGKTTRWIKSCKLISSEQIINSLSGDIQSEAYSFIARAAH
jgi:hypothetical protein